MENNFFSAFDSAVNKIKNRWEEHKAQENKLNAMRLVKVREEAAANIRQGNKDDYFAFANALGAYLQSNYRKNDLEKPLRIEDVIFASSEDRITVNIKKNASFYGGFASDFTVDYHFEVSREPFNGTLNDIISNRPPKVSAQEIQENMNHDLRKYSEQRGYTFEKVIVDDMSRCRVKITVQNVHYTPEEIFRRMGSGIC